MIICNKFNGYMPEEGGNRTYWKGGSNKQAKIANQMERDRQARMQEAIATIREIFNGTHGVNALNDYSEYDSGATYYNADGSAYAQPTKQVQDGYKTVRSSASDMAKILGLQKTSRVPTYKTVTDEDAIRSAIAAGNIYRDTELDRQSLYDQQEQAVYDLNRKSVQDQYEQAERQNRFGLARNGLMGGSADIDSNANLQKITNEGLVQAKALGQQAAGNLRSADESAKQNLISLAESGMDSGTAATLAQSQMAANQQNALGQRGASAITGLFDNLASGYLYGKMMDAYNQGYNFGTNRNYGSTAGTRNSYGGTVNR